LADAAFGLSDLHPAVVTIDLHRGHLDPTVATLPLGPAAARKVVAENVRFLGAARARGIPVVHMVTSYRDLGEIHSNPFWRAVDATSDRRGNMRTHNLDGGPGTELMPGIHAPGDRVVIGKKRYDCFLHTDLDYVLRRLGANALLISGVNTNSCVLATAITASTRDYAPIVISDCVDSMDGVAYHRRALDCISRAFGWVLPWREALAAMPEQRPAP